MPHRALLLRRVQRNFHLLPRGEDLRRGKKKTASAKPAMRFNDSDRSMHHSWAKRNVGWTIFTKPLAPEIRKRGLALEKGG
jgi:hypothetical protein